MEAPLSPCVQTAGLCNGVVVKSQHGNTVTHCAILPSLCSGRQVPSYGLTRKSQGSAVSMPRVSVVHGSSRLSFRTCTSWLPLYSLQSNTLGLSKGCLWMKGTVVAELVGTWLWSHNNRYRNECLWKGAGARGKGQIWPYVMAMSTSLYLEWTTMSWNPVVPFKGLSPMTKDLPPAPTKASTVSQQYFTGNKTFAT